MDMVHVIYSNVEPRAKEIVERVYSEALEIIKRNFSIDRHITVLFFYEEFKYKFEKVTGLWVPNVIMFDVYKLLQVSREGQIACILEEFCHALMHSFDENLVSAKVAEIYDKVAWDPNNNRYIPKKPSQ